MTGLAPRAPKRPDLRFAVIGAGMAGLLAATKLLDAGFGDVTVYEKADDVGGTWRDNTYPGIACDVPSHLYCYSFALNPEWSRMYSPGAEIQDYFVRFARERQLQRRIRFGDAVASCRFVDDRWRIETEGGRRDVADVVIAATGVLHRPRYPDLDGLDRFAGRCFHSARWDRTAVVEGSRVGVVGTGASAAQIVSALVDRVGHLTLFQRTAQWILPVVNPPYTEDDKATFRRHPEHLTELRDKLERRFDGFSAAIVDATSPEMRWIEDACRTNLAENVSDPALRDRLRPDYRAACKRLVLSVDFYDAIQRPNAELVTEPIRGVERGGVRTADGHLHPLDVLVLATGFHADAFTRPMTVTGRGGVSLDDAWAERPEAYLSVSVPDFPNFFFLNGPNGPVGNFSLIGVAELQVGYVMQLVDRLAARRCRQICASADALAEFERRRVEAAATTVWATGCRSWYLDDRGVPAAWPWPFARFRSEMAAPRLDAYDQR